MVSSPAETQVHRELDLMREMFSARIDMLETNSRRALNSVLDLINARFDNIEQKFLHQNIQVTTLAEQIEKNKKNLEELKQTYKQYKHDWFWKYFIRIMSSITAASVLGILTYLVRSKNI